MSGIATPGRGRLRQTAARSADAAARNWHRRVSEGMSALDALAANPDARAEIDGETFLAGDLPGLRLRVGNWPDRVECRSGWQPHRKSVLGAEKYRIILADDDYRVQIEGHLDSTGKPTSATLYYQQWGSAPEVLSGGEGGTLLAFAKWILQH